MSAYTPPGWPAPVPPPGAPDWEQSAQAWLLDQCPPDYRAHAVLRRHPRWSWPGSPAGTPQPPGEP